MIRFIVLGWPGVFDEMWNITIESDEPIAHQFGATLQTEIAQRYRASDSYVPGIDSIAFSVLDSWGAEIVDRTSSSVPGVIY